MIVPLLSPIMDKLQWLHSQGKNVGDFHKYVVKKAADFVVSAKVEKWKK